MKQQQQWQSAYQTSLFVCCSARLDRSPDKSKVEAQKFQVSTRASLFLLLFTRSQLSSQHSTSTRSTPRPAHPVRPLPSLDLPNTPLTSRRRPPPRRRQQPYQSSTPIYHPTRLTHPRAMSSSSTSGSAKKAHCASGSRPSLSSATSSGGVPLLSRPLADSTSTQPSPSTSHTYLSSCISLFRLASRRGLEAWNQVPPFRRVRGWEEGELLASLRSSVARGERSSRTRNLTRRARLACARSRRTGRCGSRVRSLQHSLILSVRAEEPDERESRPAKGPFEEVNAALSTSLCTLVTSCRSFSLVPSSSKAG